jgi:hypothetical protein
MGMTSKSVLYALAVVVLMGTMAVTALADSTYLIEPDVGAPGVRSDAGELQGPVETGAIPGMQGSSSDFTYLIEPDVGATVVRSDAWELREPVETGAIPDLPGSSSDMSCCSDSGDPTFRPGGP